MTVQDASPQHDGLANATVLVLDSRGKKFPAKTNASGTATIKGLADGDYTVYAAAAGYLPKAGQVTQSGGSGSVTLMLTLGTLGGSNITVNRLTYDQIIAAGIDPNDPSNQNVIEFTISPLLQQHGLVHRPRRLHERRRKRIRLHRGRVRRR